MKPESSLLHYKCPPPVPILSQLNPFHTHTPKSNFLKIHLNIIPHLGLGLPNGTFSSGFPTKTLYTLLLSPIRATCPAHLILLDSFTRTILGEKWRDYSLPHYIVFSIPLLCILYVIISHQLSVLIYLLCYTCHMAGLSHSPLFNNTV